MSRNLFNRYIWLVDTLYSSKGGLTLKEINQKWLRKDSSEGEPIPVRTFHNHCASVEDIFEIIIGCDKSTNKYFIEDAEDIKNGGIQSWLINTFAVNHLINESHKLKRRILFENIPSGQEYLTTIIEAMRDGVTLSITYHPYWGDAFDIEIEPFFVKIFKQRWYVIGRMDQLRIYALDRIEKLEPTENSFKVPKDFDPDGCFYDSYGIFNNLGDKAQEVKIKVLGGQVNYIRALPLHHSQKEIETADGYSIFTYHIKPTPDLRLELLSQGANVVVLSPPLFVDEIKNEIGQMKKNYKP